MEYFFHNYLLSLKLQITFISLSRFWGIDQTNQETKFYFLREMKTKNLVWNDWANEQLSFGKTRRWFETEHSYRKVVRVGFNFWKAHRVVHWLRLAYNLRRETLKQLTGFPFFLPSFVYYISSNGWISSLQLFDIHSSMQLLTFPNNLLSNLLSTRQGSFNRPHLGAIIPSFPSKI